MRKFNSVLSLAAALLLSACGGGATLGEGGGGLGGDGGGTTGPSSTPANIALITSSTQLPADADTAAEGILVTAIVTDRNGNTVSNAVVTFSLTSTSKAALIVGSATTGPDGTASATLTTGGNAVFPRTVSVVASVGSLRSEPRSVTVVDPDSVGAVPTVTLAASANRLDPAASSTGQGVTITATVRNPDNTPASNVLVTFNQNFAGSGTGALSPTSGRTNSNGQVSAVLTTGGNNVPRTIIVSALASDFDDSGSTAESTPVSIQVRAIQNAVSVLLSGDRTVLSPLANTPDQGILLTATVVGSGGQALSGVPVNFAASGVVIQVTQGVTDATGRAFAVATTGGNTTPRTATATASADGINSTPFVIEVRNASSLVLTSSGTQLSPTAESPAQGIEFIATLRDSNNAPLPNVAVNFTSDSGQIQVTRSFTNASGQATAVLTTGGDPSPRSILVTASATVGSQTLEATRSVSVVEQTASLVVLASNPELFSNASVAANGVTITAVVRNSGNNLVENVPVQFSSVGGGALQVVRGTTDETGTAVATLTTGGDPTARTIVVTATSGATSDNVSVAVVGSQLTINAPSAVSLNASSSVSVTLRDSGGAAVANRPVTLQSSLMNSINGATGGATANTNAQGVATFNYLPTVAGTDTLTGSAIGISDQVEVTIAAISLTLAFDPDPAPAPAEFDFMETATIVAALENGMGPIVGATIQFNSTRGMLSASSGVTDVNGEVELTIESDGSDGAGTFLVNAIAPNNGGVSATLSGEFIAINPTQVSVQAEPAKIGLNSQSVIRAVVRDADNNLVKNQRVDFVLSDPSGGRLSAASGITNSQGTVSVNYLSSTTSTAENGVRVTANVRNSGGMLLATDEVRLTVGGTALRITLGTGNELVEDTLTTYRLPYTAIITDAAGNPAPPSTVFRLKVTSLEYQEGGYDTDEDPPLQILTIIGGSPGTGVFGCLNEDIDGSGIYVMANDVNMNGILDPGNVASVPTTVALDANGIANFDIVYPQDRGNWVRVRLTATASVDGTESQEIREFVLPITAEDLESGNPPGNPSPYGTNSLCADPD